MRDEGAYKRHSTRIGRLISQDSRREIRVSMPNKGLKHCILASTIRYPASTDVRR
ncbi:hypothetical protein FA13DRAFT_1735357 [Coprinellus micaceus]|uniref:Uncharacterized protein n=1 Tax=Coprinellus micaceus TaxID=71717 RepID=A0A4Y7T3V4_COPMI|nr:hypothetical protein FA13DRAFT_1735357 [Coprinellus micaceus]